MAPRRRLVVAREMTKVHEEVVRGSAEEVLSLFEDRRPRGEVVVIVAPAEGKEAPPLASLVEEVSGLRREGLSTRDAVRAVAQKHGVSQRAVYQSWLEERDGARGKGEA
jgi:16S rRNA (cytidine1402-2'-O)-methyltransferase